jgi:hypothetical protein
VRKTASPNHAKVYIFTNDDDHSYNGQEPGRVIVGSSNLSFQGLEGRAEFNVLLKDNADYEDAGKIFNRLWDEAVPLVDASTKDEFLETVIKHTWVEKLPAPYLMYVRVLHEYFKASAETIKTPAGLTHTGDAQYMNLEYQTDAIKDGLEKIKRHSGCIIADVVGLGKSIIGVTIAANLSIPTVIICPRTLKRNGKISLVIFACKRPRLFLPAKLKMPLPLLPAPKKN